MNLISAAFIVVGAFFFLAGTVGIIRFPDTHTRLHALTKADTLGLGFTALGLALGADSAATAAKLLFIWTLVLIASTTVCYQIGRAARDEA